MLELLIFAMGTFCNDLRWEYENIAIKSYAKKIEPARSFIFMQISAWIQSLSRRDILTQLE